MIEFTREELQIIHLDMNAYIHRTTILAESPSHKVLREKIQSMIDNYCEREGDKEMNFSEALEQIKAGKLLKRSGWNGKDQFVFLVHGSEFKVNRAPLNTIFQPGTDITYRPHIDMKYQDGSVGVWLPSMGDIMAEDWIEVK